MIYKLFFSLVLTCLIFVGCLGLKPTPRYTNTNKASSVQARRASSSIDIKRLVQTSSYAGQYLIAQIENYLGVPYKWGGTNRYGMDCSGFVKTVFQNSINLDLPHNSRQLYSVGRQITSDSLTFGDLVFFKNVGARGISHVGIYLADSNFVHASTKRGVVVSNIKSKYYKKRYAGAKRIYEF